jgi:hypothetical protein
VHWGFSRFFYSLEFLLLFVQAKSKAKVFFGNMAVNSFHTLSRRTKKKQAAPLELKHSYFFVFYKQVTPPGHCRFFFEWLQRSLLFVINNQNLGMKRVSQVGVRTNLHIIL